MTAPILTIDQEADLLAKVADLRTKARALRTQADAPTPADDEGPDLLALAAEADRQADDVARTVARSRDAERAKLDADLRVAQVKVLDTHRRCNPGSPDIDAAHAAERACLERIVAFLRRTTKVVPFHQVRR